MPRTGPAIHYQRSAAMVAAHDKGQPQRAICGRAAGHLGSSASIHTDPACVTCVRCMRIMDRDGIPYTRGAIQQTSELDHAARLLASIGRTLDAISTADMAADIPAARAFRAARAELESTLHHLGTVIAARRPSDH